MGYVPAVIPILTNAGASALPVLAAAGAGALALVRDPRALAAACRRRPHVPVLIVACVAAVWLVATHWPAGARPPAAREEAGPPSQTDWAAVALEIIRNEEIARASAHQAPTGGDPATAGAAQPGADLVPAPPGLQPLPPIAPGPGGATRPAAGPSPTPPFSHSPSHPAPHGPTPPLSRSPALGSLFRLTPSRTGHDGGPSPLGLSALWEYRDGDAMFLSSPLVVGGRVYGASCLLDIAGNYGKLFCLDADTGKSVWEADSLGGRELKGFFSSPALSTDGKRLVIGQGLHSDKESDLLCADAATGRLCWRVHTPLHIEGSPAIHGDVAVAGAGAIEGPDGKPVGDPGFVIAVRISDGKELWRQPVADPESSPAIGPDGTVYIGSGVNGNAVVALRPESDAELRAKKRERVLWRTATPYPATGSVALSGDLVLIGVGAGDYVHAAPNPAGAVLALDRATGKVRWQARLNDAVLGPVAAGGGKVICPVRNGEVVALGLADGKRLWGQRVSGNTPVLAGAALTGKYVYAMSRDGSLAVLNAADGKIIERQEVNAAGRPGELGLALSSPTVARGKLYVGSETGGLRCFRGARAER